MRNYKFVCWDVWWERENKIKTQRDQGDRWKFSKSITRRVFLKKKVHKKGHLQKKGAIYFYKEKNKKYINFNCKKNDFITFLLWICNIDIVVVIAYKKKSENKNYLLILAIVVIFSGSGYDVFDNKLKKISVACSILVYFFLAVCLFVKMGLILNININ